MYLNAKQTKADTNPERAEAQAMVEFALVLVALLMVVFILIEAGRAIFLYAAVTNSSREAVRYGSAYGLSDTGNLRYCDCAAIRGEAIRVGFLLDLQPGDITIEYLEADGTVFAVCDAASGEDPDVKDIIETGDRIQVTINYLYNPIVPLLPQVNNNFESSSTRTILGEVKLRRNLP